MQLDLQGKVAIVTGGAKGIGRSIVEKVLAEGARVVIADIDRKEGEAFAAQLGDMTSFACCDITDARQVESLIGGVAGEFGRLDIMVNNAGINTGPQEARVTVDAFPIDVWHRIIDTDLNGTFYCCKAAAAQMVSQKSGVIINIGSVAGVVALRLQIAYVAAKAAIIKMTEAMACELGPLGVRVNTVSPGSTLTDGTRALFYGNKVSADKMCSFIPQRRPGDSSEIADAVVFLASDRASYVNGQNLVVDGGWTCGFNRDF